jgi:hypothetical protein
MLKIILAWDLSEIFKLKILTVHYIDTLKLEMPKSQNAIIPNPIILT